MSPFPTVRVEKLLAEDRGISVGVMYPGKDTLDGVPLIRAGDIKLGTIDPKVNFRISEEVHQEYRRTVLEGGEVLITLVGNPGVAAVVPAEMSGWNAARAIAVVRLKDSNDAQFFKVAMSFPSVQHTIKNVCNTTVQATLNLKEIRSLEIPWPARPVRDEIAAILGALDEKIELNRRMSATLEDMARSLYRSWFINFDPVHAKVEGRLPAFMDEAAAALFPDHIGDNGLPEGWKEGVLGELIEFNPSERLPKGSIAPYLDMKSLPTSGMTHDVPVERAFTSGTKFRAGDTLLARITPCLENGKTALVQNFDYGCVGWGSTEFIVMRPKGDVPKAYPYSVARSSDFRDEAIASMTGSSGRQRADASRIKSIQAALPPDAIMREFGVRTDPLLQKVEALGAEVETLAALRDALLPRLMSGELHVGEAREQIEEVA